MSAVWPDNWNFRDPDFQVRFIRSRLDEARRSAPGKSVILEEFGKISEDPAQTARGALPRERELCGCPPLGGGG